MAHQPRTPSSHCDRWLLNGTSMLSPAPGNNTWHLSSIWPRLQERVALTWHQQPKGDHGSCQPASILKRCDCVKAEVVPRNVIRDQPLVLLSLAKSLAVTKSSRVLFKFWLLCIHTPTFKRRLYKYSEENFAFRLKSCTNHFSSIRRYLCILFSI